MWAPLIFTLFVAGATANCGWKTVSEYWYEVHSTTLVSLPEVGNLYSGMVFKANLSVRPRTHNHLSIQIHEPKYAKVQLELPKGMESPIPEKELNYETMPLSTEPFEVKFYKGVVIKLMISKDVPIWEVNIIRSIVSQLQVDTQGSRIIGFEYSSIPKSDERYGTYHIMEDTVEGECEVLYDINPLPKCTLQTMPHLAPQAKLADGGEIIDIVKTKNFTNCQHRPGYHFGLTGLNDWILTSNNMDNFLSRSSVSRIIVSGSLTNYIIQSSVTTNKVILSPKVYNSGKGEAVSRVNLTLSSIQGVSTEIPTLKNPQILKKLVYDYNSSWTTDFETPMRNMWNDRQKKSSKENYELFSNSRSNLNKIDRNSSIEESSDVSYQDSSSLTQAPESPFLPYFVGYTGHSIQQAKDIDIKKVVQSIALEIAEQLNDESDVPRKNTLTRFSILARLIRTMNIEQLKLVTRELYTEKKTNPGGVSDQARNAWMAYCDAVTQAGTGPALLAIEDFINSKMVKAEEAAQIVGPLAITAKYPTTAYLNKFFDLVKNPNVTSQPYLNVSAIYSFTNLVRMVQVDVKTAHNRYSVHDFGYLTGKHETTITNVYIPYFARKLEEAVIMGDSNLIQTYIRALGNIGHPKIASIFESYLNGKQQLTDFQRLFIVVCMDKLATINPNSARMILYNIYSNTGEAYQVRVAAVFNLMKTNPPERMLQRMAQFTHEDPSYHVRSAVKSAIESLSVLPEESPFNGEIRKAAQAAVHMLTPQKFGHEFSEYKLKGFIERELNFGYTASLKTIDSQDIMGPQSIFLHFAGILNGFNVNVFDAEFMVSSVYDLINSRNKNHQSSPLMSMDTEQSQSETEKEFTTENIKKILNFESTSRKQFEGNFLIGMAGYERFFTFDKSTFTKLATNIPPITKCTVKKKEIYYQKMYNKYSIVIGLPTVTGLPLVFTLQTPSLLFAKGNISVKAKELPLNKEGNHFNGKTVSVFSAMHLQYSTRAQSKLSFITPFDHTRYIAGYDKNTQIEIPLKANFYVDLSRNNHHVKLELEPLFKGKKQKLFHHSTWPYVSIENLMEFIPVAESSQTRRLMGKLLPIKKTVGSENLGLFFNIEGDFNVNNLNLEYIKNIAMKKDMLDNLIIGEDRIEHSMIDIYFDACNSFTESVVFSASHRYSCADQTITEEEGTDNYGMTTHKEVDSQARVQEFLKKVSSAVNNSSSKVIDLGVQFQGSKKTELAITVAVAISPEDEKTKVLGYGRINHRNEGFELCLDVTGHTPNQAIIKSVKGDWSSVIRGKINFGTECRSGYKIDISGKLNIIQKSKQYLERDSILQKVKNLIEQGHRYQGLQELFQLFDSLNLTFHFEKNNSKDVTSLVQPVHHYLSLLGSQSDTKSIRSDFSESVEINVEAVTTPGLETTIVFFYTPCGIVEYSWGLEGPNGMYQKMLSTTEKNLMDSNDSVYNTGCTIDQNRIETFEGKTYWVHMEKAWYVMSLIDFEEDNSTAKSIKHLIVLIKNNKSKQKSLKVVLKGSEEIFINVHPNPKDVQLKGSVSINGNEVPVPTDHVYTWNWKSDISPGVITRGTPTGEIIINSPEYGFEILYNGGSVRLGLDEEYMNRVRGLCGINNRDNFGTPQKYVLSNEDEFAAVWDLLSSESRLDKMKNSAKEHSLNKRNVNIVPVISEEGIKNADSYETSYATQESASEETDEDSISWIQLMNNSPECAVRNIRVIKKEGRECYSVKRQPTCASHCYAKSTQMKTGKFYCYRKFRTIFEWPSLIRVEADPNFGIKGKSEELTFRYPTKCIKR